MQCQASRSPRWVHEGAIACFLVGKKLLFIPTCNMRDSSCRPSASTRKLLRSGTSWQLTIRSYNRSILRRLRESTCLLKGLLLPTTFKWLILLLESMFLQHSHRTNFTEQTFYSSGKHANCKTCTKRSNKSMKPFDPKEVVEDNSTICLGTHQAI